MKKTTITALLTGTMLLGAGAEQASARGDFFYDYLTEEEATTLLTNSIEDLKEYEGEVSDIRDILLEAIAYEGETTSDEWGEWESEYKENLKDIDAILARTYNLNNKDYSLLTVDEYAVIDVQLSHWEADVEELYFYELGYDSEYSQNFHLLPEIGSHVEATSLITQTDMRLYTVSDIMNEMISKKEAIDMSYDIEKFDNYKFDNTSAEDVKGLLLEQIRAEDAVLDILYKMKDFALLSMNGTNSVGDNIKYDKSYNIFQNSIDRISNVSNYKGINTSNIEEQVEINIAETNFKEIELQDMSTWSLLPDTGLGTKKNSLISYVKLNKAIQIVFESREYANGILSDIDSTLDSDYVAPTSDVGTINKEKSIQLVDQILSQTERINDLTKEMQSIVHKAYLSESEEYYVLEKEYEEKHEEWNRIAYESGLTHAIYKQNVSFYPSEDLNSKVSLELRSLEADAYVWSYFGYGNEISTHLNQINEASKSLEDYQHELLSVKEQLLGQEVANPYNETITLVERESLYADDTTIANTGGTIAPQTVKAKAKKGNWILISTWMGDKWINPEDYIVGDKVEVNAKIELTERMNLHNLPFDREVTNSTIAPQIINAKYKYGDWYAIDTWLGTKFIKTNFEEEDFEAYLNTSERLHLLSSPDIKARTGATVSPQSLKVLKRNGEFLQINTWLGPMYIKPANDAPVRFVPSVGQLDVTERVSFHTLPDENHITPYSIAPQTVNSIKKLSDDSGWYLIQTWLGEYWIKL